MPNDKLELGQASGNTSFDRGTHNAIRSKSYEHGTWGMPNLSSLLETRSLESPLDPPTLPPPSDSTYWHLNMPENLSQGPASQTISSPPKIKERASISSPPGFLPNFGCPGKPSATGFHVFSMPNRLNMLGLRVGYDYSTGDSRMYGGSLGDFSADQPAPFDHPGVLWKAIPNCPGQTPKPHRITRKPKPRSFYCGFCMKNKERPEVYRSHNLKAFNVEKNTFELQCPILRGYCCPICNATGDDAHTVTYCPKITKTEGHRPVSIVSMLRQSDHNSAGYKRSDFRKTSNNWQNPV